MSEKMRFMCDCSSFEQIIAQGIEPNDRIRTNKIIGKWRRKAFKFIFIICALEPWMKLHTQTHTHANTNMQLLSASVCVRSFTVWYEHTPNIIVINFGVLCCWCFSDFSLRFICSFFFAAAAAAAVFLYADATLIQLHACVSYACGLATVNGVTLLHNMYIPMYISLFFSAYWWGRIHRCTWCCPTMPSAVPFPLRLHISLRMPSSSPFLFCSFFF